MKSEDRIRTIALNCFAQGLDRQETKQIIYKMEGKHWYNVLEVNAVCLDVFERQERIVETNILLATSDRLIKQLRES